MNSSNIAPKEAEDYNEPEEPELEITGPFNVVREGHIGLNADKTGFEVCYFTRCDDLSLPDHISSKNEVRST